MFQTDEKIPEEINDDFVWRLTKETEEGSVVLTAGGRLANFPPNSYLPLIGKALIQLGTQLMQSRVADDDDEWDD